MKIISKIKFGSHLYGTNTPQSDLDIKGVYLPCARDILLQKVNPMISESRPKQTGEKNTSDDIDFELYSLQRFLELLQQGQMVALDILFAPETSMLEKPDPIWLEIQNTLAPKILTKGALSFIKYCQQQANKYGIKGSRVAAIREALNVLRKIEVKYGPKEPLGVAENELQALTMDNEFLVIDQKTDRFGTPIFHLDVCGQKSMFTTSIKVAKENVTTLLSKYGRRPLAAENNEGVDWKALSHAVRVGHQALEFFKDKKITFPRPEAAHLLQIKLGHLTYSSVAQEIETLIDEITQAAQVSDLPEYADQQYIDNFILKHYTNQVLSDGTAST